MSKTKEGERLQAALAELHQHAPLSCQVVRHFLADMKHTNLALESALDNGEGEIKSLKAELMRLKSLEDLETKNKELTSQLQMIKDQSQHVHGLLQQAREHAKQAQQEAAQQVRQLNEQL